MGGETHLSRPTKIKIIMEESIYSKCTRLVKEGAKFHVDFTNRNLRVGKTYFIKNGEYEGRLGIPRMTTENVLKAIERKYGLYYHSIPSERSDGKTRKYFQALPEHELDDSDLMYGVPRDAMQFRLEAFVLMVSILGYLKWEEVDGNWFWQSKEFPSLIILREWVEGA